MKLHRIIVDCRVFQWNKIPGTLICEAIEKIQFLDTPQDNLKDQWCEHIVKEGSRNHVVSYDNQGSLCNVPNCELNKHRKPQPKWKCEVPEGVDMQALYKEAPKCANIIGPLVNAVEENRREIERLGK